MGTSGSWAVLDGQSTISQAEAVEDDAAEEEEREEIAQELKMFQPIYDDDGVVRFRKNEVVRFILDEGGLTLNDIASRDFSQADLEQFYQLIGYSVAGFHELSEVSDSTALAASSAARKDLGLPDDQSIGCRDDGCEIHCGVSDRSTV